MGATLAASADQDHQLTTTFRQLRLPHVRPQSCSVRQHPLPRGEQRLEGQQRTCHRGRHRWPGPLRGLRLHQRHHPNRRRLHRPRVRRDRRQHRPVLKVSRSRMRGQLPDRLRQVYDRRLQLLLQLHGPEHRQRYFGRRGCEQCAEQCWVRQALFLLTVDDVLESAAVASPASTAAQTSVSVHRIACCIVRAVLVTRGLVHGFRYAFWPVSAPGR